MVTPEGRVKAKVRKLLDSYPNLYRFMPVPHGYQASSLDYFVCYLGRFIAIETKAPGKLPTKLQSETMRRIERAGGHAFVVGDDEELEALKLFLDHLH